jgi:hypothetical protein
VLRRAVTGGAGWSLVLSMLAVLAAAPAQVRAQAPPQTPTTQTPTTQTPTTDQTSTPAKPNQASTPAKTTKAPVPAKAGQASKSGKAGGAPTRYLPNRFAGRAGIYYKTVWGVDSLSVKLTESGQIIRFAWRVLDAERAKPLSNKEAKPSLDDPQAGVSLVVPSMENIGMLRQSSTPEEGKTYWMAFSNKGRLVKKGHRVNVVIGQFHADGLAVDE